MTIRVTPSYWLSLQPFTPGPPLRGDQTAGVVVCGGGYTGLWTAIFRATCTAFLAAVVLAGAGCPRVPPPPPEPPPRVPRGPGGPADPVPPPVERPTPPPESRGTVPEFPPPVKP